MINKISAVILTKGDSPFLKKTIESVRWCDELLILLDNDHNTVNIDDKKIKVLKHKVNNNFAGQRNFGLIRAQSPWVLYVDDDELIDDDLKNEILSVINVVKNKYSGYYLKRKDKFLGKWLNYGETAHIRLVRLGKKECGIWHGNIHETWEINGFLGALTHPILHFPHQNMKAFVRKINAYTDIAAETRHKQGKEINTWGIICYPLGKFLNNYILLCGFLDGVEGLIFAMMMSFHSFLVRSKIWFLSRRQAHSYEAS